MFWCPRQKNDTDTNEMDDSVPLSSEHDAHQTVKAEHGTHQTVQLKVVQTFQVVACSLGRGNMRLGGAGSHTAAQDDAGFHQPSNGSKSPLSSPSSCTRGIQNPATCGTNRGHLVFREGHVESLLQHLARLWLRGLQAIDQLFWG